MTETIGTWPCACSWCQSWNGIARCPDCGARIPATWDRCWPCEQERQAALLAIQQYWTC